MEKGSITLVHLVMNSIEFKVISKQYFKSVFICSFADSVSVKHWVKQKDCEEFINNSVSIDGLWYSSLNQTMQITCIFLIGLEKQIHTIFCIFFLHFYTSSVVLNWAKEN